MSPLCALLLVMTCHSKPAVLLNVGQQAVALADTWSTQRLLSQPTPGIHYYEADVLAKPFQEHGPAFACVTTVGGSYLLRALAGHMRHSPRWHKVWWLPQVLAIGGNIYGVQNNVRLYRAKVN